MAELALAGDHHGAYYRHLTFCIAIGAGVGPPVNGIAKPRDVAAGGHIPRAVAEGEVIAGGWLNDGRWDRSCRCRARTRQDRCDWRAANHEQRRTYECEARSPHHGYPLPPLAAVPS